jgi:hypothetical protein
LHVERDEQRFGVDAGKSEIGRVGGAAGGRAVDVSAGDGREQAGFEPVAKSGEGLVVSTQWRVVSFQLRV